MPGNRDILYVGLAIFHQGFWEGGDAGWGNLAYEMGGEGRVNRLPATAAAGNFLVLGVGVETHQ